ncbi:Uncharacterised protein [Yersinia pseudotuberculosis]|nr:Uncharacterised protein [Yersinia pseudotuberculosis]
MGFMETDFDHPATAAIIEITFAVTDAVVAGHGLHLL